MAKNVFTIDAGLGFATSLVQGLISRLRPQDDPLALARAVIFLPTRRSARALSEEFTRQLDGAVLLPSIRTLGDVDEDELNFEPGSDDLTLPPAIAPLRQRLLLAQLIQRWSLNRGDKLSFVQATALASSLAAFLFEIQTANASLDRLDSLIDGTLAAHWTDVRNFLLLLRDAWPPVLAAEGAMDPAARRNLTLDALSRGLARFGSGPVIAAGSTGSIPATARLLSAITALPHGAVILPDLDRNLDEDSWNRLDEGHPQFGLKQLLTALETTRAEVQPWQEPEQHAARRVLVRQALLPAPLTDAWQRLAQSGTAALLPGLAGLTLIEAANPSEEALVIALALRRSLLESNTSAALVTPDRKLARQVAAELRRWNIAIDDSAGRPLAHTLPGEFLCLLSEAAECGFAPVSLLALLKHPLTSCGQNPAAFRQFARMLDLNALRGPTPAGGRASSSPWGRSEAVSMLRHGDPAEGLSRPCRVPPATAARNRLHGRWRPVLLPPRHESAALLKDQPEVEPEAARAVSISPAAWQSGTRDRQVCARKFQRVRHLGWVRAMHSDRAYGQTAEMLPGFVRRT